MTVSITIAVVVLLLAALIGLYALFTASGDDVRATVGDLLYFCAVAIFVAVTVLTGSAIIFDVALIASLLGILATLALARILTGGRR